VADDFEALAASIRRVSPGSRIEPATDEQLAAVRREYPDAPAHYTEFLRRVGWGSLGGSDFMLYSGLVGPADIFDPATAATLSGLAILGDDFSGCVVGFDTRAGWRLVSFDNGYHAAPEPLEQRTLAEFIAQRVADAQDAEPGAAPDPGPKAGRGR
jgi:hypothetical protein